MEGESTSPRSSTASSWAVASAPSSTSSFEYVHSYQQQQHAAAVAAAIANSTVTDRPRPSSAGNTRLRQKPSTPKHAQDFFSALGVDAPRSTGLGTSSSSAPASFFSAPPPAAARTDSAASASQLFSMDAADDTLGGDDDGWGVDSPSILSPVAGSGSAVDAPCATAEDDFSWVDDEPDPSSPTVAVPVPPPAPVEHAEAVQQYAVEPPGHETNLDAHEQQEEPSVTSALPTTETANLSFSYNADEGAGAAADDQGWNDGWSDGEAGITLDDSTLAADVDAAWGGEQNESAGPSSEPALPVHHEPAVPVHHEPEVQHQHEANVPPPPILHNPVPDLAAIVSPTAAMEGEFWGDEAEDDLFDDQGEEGQRSPPADAAPVMSSPPLPDVGALAMNDAEDSGANVTSTEPSVNHEVREDPQEYQQAYPSLNETDGAIQEKSEWEDWTQDAFTAADDQQQTHEYAESPFASPPPAEHVSVPYDHVSHYNPSDATGSVEVTAPADEREHQQDEFAGRSDHFGSTATTTDSTGFFTDNNSYEQPNDQSYDYYGHSNGGGFDGGHQYGYGHGYEGYDSAAATSTTHDANYYHTQADYGYGEVEYNAHSSGHEVPGHDESHAAPQDEAFGRTAEALPPSLSSAAEHSHFEREVPAEWGTSARNEQTNEATETPFAGSSDQHSFFAAHNTTDVEEEPSQSQVTFGGVASVYSRPDGSHHGPSSVASFAEASSAGATFGGSDAVSDDDEDARFSDGNASETRSMFGSSSAGTAFITEPPTSSDGQASLVGGDDASSMFGGGGSEPPQSSIGDAPYEESQPDDDEDRSLFDNEVEATENSFGLAPPSSDRNHGFGDSPASFSYGSSDFAHDESTQAVPESDGSSMFGTTHASVEHPFSSSTESAFDLAPPGPSIASDHSTPDVPASTAHGFAPSNDDDTASHFGHSPSSVDHSFTSAPPVSSMSQVENAQAVVSETSEEHDVNPFASSSDSSPFASAPTAFGAPSPPVTQAESPSKSDFVPSAASLFGSSDDTSGGFGAFGAPPLTSNAPASTSSTGYVGFVETHELQTEEADPSDLFANSAPAPGFGGFGQSSSTAGFFGQSSVASSAPSSAYGSGYGYDAAPPQYGGYSDYGSPAPAAADMFGSSTPASSAFGAAPPSAASVFGGHSSQAEPPAFGASPPSGNSYYEQQSYDSSYGFGGAADASAVFGGSAHHQPSADSFFGGSSNAHDYATTTSEPYAEQPSSSSSFAHDVYNESTSQSQPAAFDTHPQESMVPPTQSSSFFASRSVDAPATSFDSPPMPAAAGPPLSRTTSNASSSSLHQETHATAKSRSHPTSRSSTPFGEHGAARSPAASMQDANSFFGVRSESAPPPDSTPSPDDAYGSGSFGVPPPPSSDPNAFFGGAPPTTHSAGPGEMVPPSSTPDSGAAPSHGDESTADAGITHAEGEQESSHEVQQPVPQSEPICDEPESSLYPFGGDHGGSSDPFGAPVGGAGDSAFGGPSPIGHGEASDDTTDPSAYFGSSSGGAFDGFGGSAPPANDFFSSSAQQQYDQDQYKPYDQQQHHYAESYGYNHQQQYHGYDAHAASYGVSTGGFDQPPQDYNHGSFPTSAPSTTPSGFPQAPPQAVSRQDSYDKPSFAAQPVGRQDSYDNATFPSSPAPAVPSFPSQPMARQDSYDKPTFPSSPAPTMPSFPSSPAPAPLELAAHGSPQVGFGASAPVASSQSSNYAVSYDAKPAHATPKAATPVITSNKYKDPTIVAPSCLVSFGFGGNAVTMFPKRKLRLNATSFGARNSPRTPMGAPQFESPQGELRKGPVSVYRMDQLCDSSKDLAQLDKFPGPLSENVAEETILQYVEEQINNASSASTAFEEDERLLMGILRVLIKCNGKLRSDPSANPNDPQSPEVQLVSLLNESEQRRRRNQPSAFPAPKPVQYASHPDAAVRNANRLRELLLLGDRKAAVDVAIQTQMWPEAMLIGSFTDKDEYKRVLCAYFTSHYAPGDPCRALFLSFADQQEKSVHEPQKLMQGQNRDDSSSILSSWVIHVQMLLANRTADTSKILIELGERLWREASAVVAAHVCFLLAGLSVEAPSPNSKIALLGADHKAPEQARFYVSPLAVQRTEIYEWVQKKATQSATSMIPFQGYKLIYAMILADHGKLETAFKYVNSMLSVIRAVTANMKPGTSMYLEGMQNQLTVLDDRLRQHLGQDRAASVAAASAKQGKWGLGSALSIMGKIVNRVVEGNDAPQQVSAPPNSNNSLFQGAPNSNNSNATPNYPSASAVGYPPSQGPPSNSGSYGPGSFGGPQSGGPTPPGSQFGAPPQQSGRRSAPLRSNSDFSAPRSSCGDSGFGGPQAGYGGSQAGFGGPQPGFGGPQPGFGGPQPGFGGPQPGFGGPQPGLDAPSAAAAPKSPPKFQKPSLDLSGDAGNSGFGNEPARRTSEVPKSPRSLGEGPGSDKGSASPKFADTKKGGRSKTPPPSRSSSGWLSGLSTFIAAKMNPEAKVAKLGEQMEAYFDEEKKRWVFPGETQADEPTIPSAPPIGPLPGSTPSSSHGPPSGPPGAHSAPGSLSGPGAPSNDPLAALMAPPPARSLMKKDPVAAMMAPPSRPMYGQQRSSAMPAAKRPPRPQFAVFKPVPGATTTSDPPAPADEPPASQ